jgi:hypothetical protein
LRCESISINILAGNDLRVSQCPGRGNVSVKDAQGIIEPSPCWRVRPDRKVRAAPALTAT